MSRDRRRSPPRSARPPSHGSSPGRRGESASVAAPGTSSSLVPWNSDPQLTAVDEQAAPARPDGRPRWRDPSAGASPVARASRRSNCSGSQLRLPDPAPESRGTGDAQHVRLDPQARRAQRPPQLELDRGLLAGSEIGRERRPRPPRQLSRCAAAAPPARSPRRRRTSNTTPPAPRVPASQRVRPSLRTRRRSVRRSPSGHGSAAPSTSSSPPITPQVSVEGGDGEAGLRRARRAGAPARRRPRR